MSIGSIEPTLSQPESSNGRTQAFLVLVGVLVLALTLTLPPLTAEANTVGVSAYCPSSSPGGYFYSKGKVQNFQRHEKTGFADKEFNYQGIYWRTANWGGGFVGYQSATLWSMNTFVDKSATCPG